MTDFPKIHRLSPPLLAEGLGTALLVAAVVGSGIMGDRLSADDAVALLANTAATGAMLYVLITLFGPISGAHFNPVVSLIFALRGTLALRRLPFYVLAQGLGGVLGTVLAHLMFDLPVVEWSQHVRTGGPQWLAEGVATFGLILTILGGLRVRPAAVPGLVALYITSAYWFTASTSFANPAVALARALTNSFSGIRPLDVPGFALAECAGALAALAVAQILFGAKPTPDASQGD